MTLLSKLISVSYLLKWDWIVLCRVLARMKTFDAHKTMTDTYQILIFLPLPVPRPVSHLT